MDTKGAEIGQIPEVPFEWLIAAGGEWVSEGLWGAVHPIPNPISYSDQITSQARKRSWWGYVKFNVSQQVCWRTGEESFSMSALLVHCEGFLLPVAKCWFPLVL